MSNLKKYQTYKKLRKCNLQTKTYKKNLKTSYEQTTSPSSYQLKFADFCGVATKRLKSRTRKNF